MSLSHIPETNSQSQNLFSKLANDPEEINPSEHKNRQSNVPSREGMNPREYEERQFNVPIAKEYNHREFILRQFKVPLPDDYEFFTVYQKECEQCKEIIYYRMSISPSSMMHTERTDCKCFKLRGVGQSRNHIDLSEFKAWDLLGGVEDLKSCIAENSEDARLIKNLNTYVERFTKGFKGLCLYGLTGRGKTHCALAVGNAIKAKGFSVLALKSIDLLNMLRRTYRQNDGQKEVKLIRALMEVDLLIIDDLGSEKPSGWVKEKLYEIVDSRHGKKTCIFTTNLGGQELAKELGSAIASRVFGVGYAVAVKGRDKRQNIASFSDVGKEITLFELEMRD